jgi:hypothetical protein
MHHEHNRYDRDDSIKLDYSNAGSADERLLKQFEKISDMNTYGVPYDLSSIMHYGNNYGDPVFLETINPDYQKTIGQEDNLSFLDIKTANLVYCKSNFEHITWLKLKFHFHRKMQKYLSLPKKWLHKSKNMYQLYLPRWLFRHFL